MTADIGARVAVNRWRSPAARAGRTPGSMVLFCLSLCLALASCGRHAGPARPTVVLYSSVDDPILRQVLAVFETETGVKVDVVGDTEATKTFGLVQRVLAERASPRADVWWSSEPFGTMRLDEEGALAPYSSPAAEKTFERGWPVRYRAGDQTWYGFAARSRVIAYNTKRVQADAAPRTLRELAEPLWKGRVGMARPQFGTTRGHMAALVTVWGADATKDWLATMKANGLHLYDGNAAVARAIAQGEIDAGLCDTDDVWDAQRNTWPVGFSFEPLEAGVADRAVRWLSAGALMLPNTVALLKGAPHPIQAAALIDFLLSERVEKLLAQSDSHNIPIRPALLNLVAGRAPPEMLESDSQTIAAHLPEAARICDEALGMR
jgi:iron(III) transport system substrate-binding protein